MMSEEEIEVRIDFTKLILQALQKGSGELAKIMEVLNDAIEDLEVAP